MPGPGNRVIGSSPRGLFTRSGGLRGPIAAVAALALAVGLSAMVVQTPSARASVAPVTAAPNPDLDGACGIDINLIIDRSGSIGSNNTAVHNAAQSMVDALNGTGSRVQVISFSTTATALKTDGSNSGLLTDLSFRAPPFSVPTFASSGSTNWDDAFEMARRSPAGSAPLTVMVTDGDPTIHNSTQPSGHGLGTTAGPNDLDPAVVEANLLKAASSHIFTIGVGSALSSAASLARLQAISGPDQLTFTGGVPNISLGTADYTLVTSFSSLQSTMRSFVRQLCGSSLNITKWIQPAGGGASYKASAPFTFDVTTSAPVSWKQPATGTGTSATLATSPAATANFSWLAGSASVSASERDPGPDLVYNGAHCVLTSFDGTAAAELLDTRGSNSAGSAVTPRTMAIGTVTNDHAVNCDVFNREIRKPVVSVTKTTVPSGSAQGFGFTLTQGATTVDALSGVKDGAGASSFSAVLPGTYTVAEPAVAGWTKTAASCDDQGTQAVETTSPVGLVLVEGAHWSCRFTNTQEVATLSLVKSSATASITQAGQVVPYTLTVHNTGNVPLSGITVSDPRCNAAPAYVSGDANSDSKLGVTESWVYSCSHTVTQADIEAGGNLSNTATADSVESPPATSTKDIPVAQIKGLHVVKTSTTSTITAVGQVVPYVFAVTNTGNTTLTGVTVVDPKCTSTPPTYLSGDTNTNGALDLAETWLYGCSHTVSAGDVAGGVGLSNTVTAGSAQSPPATDTLTIPVARIVIAKSSTTTSITAAGQAVPYTLTVTNGGSMPLTGVTVVDPNCSSAPSLVSGDTDTNGKLDLSETWTYTCSHTVTQAELDAGGTLVNTAVADSTESLPASDTVRIPVTRTPAIKVVKGSTTTSITAAGQSVPYSFLVTNAGNVTLTGVVVSDPLCSSAPSLIAGDTDSDGKLDLTEAWSYTCARTVTQAELDAGGKLSNTVTADSVESAPATSGLDIPISQSAALTLAKSAKEASYAKAGEVLHYAYLVTNAGNVTLAGITVSDDRTTVTCPIGSLAPAAFMTCSASYTVTQTDVDAGAVTNIAHAAAGQTSSPNAVVTVPLAAIALAKSGALDVTVVTPSGRADAGDAVHFILTVTNAGNLPLSGVTVSDPLCDASPAYVAGDTNSNGKLDLTEIWTFTCSYTLTQADLDAGAVSNTATADSTESDPAQASTRVVIAQAPQLAVVKQSTTTSVTAAGQVVPYTFSVSNAGNVTLTGITVVDPRCAAAPVRTGGDANSNSKLETTETWVFACNHTVTQGEIDSGGVLSNTVTTDSEQSGPATDTKTIPVGQTRSLSLDKTAIESSYDSVGDVIHYSYLVTNAGNTTLAGPVTVLDDKAVVSCPAGALVPAAALTCTATRTVTQADLDAGHVTNVARASAGDTQSGTDTVTVPATQAPALGLDKQADTGTYDSVGDTIGYTYVVTNSGNVTLIGPISVTDDKVAATCPPTASLAPGATVVCTASYVVTQADLDAGAVVNIATASNGRVTSLPDTVTVTADQKPARTLVKTADPASGTIVRPGDTITYSVTYTNTGNVTLGDEVVTDVLPDGAIAGAVADGGTYDSAAQVASWHTGATAPGASKALHWTVTVASGLPAGSAIINVARVGETVSGGTTNPVASGALTLVKTASAGSVQVGAQLTYTLAVTATGDLDQTGVVVTDVVPDGTSYDAGSAAPAAIASYDAATRTVSWNVGDLAAGHTRGGLTFAVIAGAVPTSGQVTNVGSATSSETPSTPSNPVDTTVTPAEATGGGGGGITGGGGTVTLPHTGMAVPLWLALLVSLVLIGSGAALTRAVTTRRR